jgi:hypothetical protein
MSHGVDPKEDDDEEAAAFVISLILASFVLL